MTSNPMFKRDSYTDEMVYTEKPATIQGVINKSVIMLLLMSLTAAFSWDLLVKGFSDKANILLIVGLVAGLILAFITFFSPQNSKYTAPAYALCEGFVVGAISCMYESAYNGIVINAILITILTMLTMLLLYKTKVIEATPTFYKVVITSTVAVMIFYVVGFIASLAGHPMTIFNGGLLGIGISLLICVIAALNFIIDFERIKITTQNYTPEYFDWYNALSLLVTLIWLYFEILRLLSLLNRRN